jgi:hypothetical protein
MNKATIPLAAALVLLCTGCASTNGASSSSASAREYWTSHGAGTSQFPGDNLACASRASRLGGVSGAAPENRIDRPIQKWPNATAQEAYDSCMLERGWRPAG